VQSERQAARKEGGARGARPLAFIMAGDFVFVRQAKAKELLLTPLRGSGTS